MKCTADFSFNTRYRPPFRPHGRVRCDGCDRDFPPSRVARIEGVMLCRGCNAFETAEAREQGDRSTREMRAIFDDLTPDELEVTLAALYGPAIR